MKGDYYKRINHAKAELRQILTQANKTQSELDKEFVIFELAGKYACSESALEKAWRFYVERGTEQQNNTKL